MINFPSAAKALSRCGGLEPTNDGDCMPAIGSRYHVTLERVGRGSATERLGLFLAYRQDYAHLPILKINGGLAERWNMDCPSNVKLQKGDLILEVNGVSENSSK